MTTWSTPISLFSSFLCLLCQLYSMFYKCFMCFTDVCDVCAFHTNNKDYFTSTAEMIMRLRGLPFICSLSVLTAIFQVNRDYSVILELRMMEVVKNEAIKTCKAPVKSSSPTNPTPDFLQAGCPSCRPTNSAKAQNEKISHSADSYT